MATSALSRWQAETSSSTSAEGLSMDKEERGSQAEDDEVDAKNNTKEENQKRKQLLSRKMKVIEECGVLGAANIDVVLKRLEKGESA